MGTPFCTTAAHATEATGSSQRRLVSVSAACFAWLLASSVITAATVSVDDFRIDISSDAEMVARRNEPIVATRMARRTATQAAARDARPTVRVRNFSEATSISSMEIDISGCGSVITGGQLLGGSPEASWSIDPAGKIMRVDFAAPLAPGGELRLLLDTTHEAGRSAGAMPFTVSHVCNGLAPTAITLVPVADTVGLQVAGPSTGSFSLQSGSISQLKYDSTAAGSTVLAAGATGLGIELAPVVSYVNPAGGTTVLDDGTLRLSSTTTLDPTTRLSIGGSATLDLASADAAIETLALSGTGSIVGSGSLSVASLDVTNAAGLATISVNLTGSTTLTKTGSGTMLLAGSNDHSGGTLVDAGVVVLGSRKSLSPNGLAVVADGATLALRADGGFTTADFADLHGNTLPGVHLGNAAIAGFDTAGFDATLAGDLFGSRGLAKLGEGMLTLTGTNAFSGDTFIREGGLVAGSQAAFGTGAIILAPGTMLDLGGLVFGNTIINNGGTILGAANYVGTQSVNGAVDFDGPVVGTVSVGSGGVAGFGSRINGRVEIGQGGVADLAEGVEFGESAELINNGVLRANRETELVIGQPIAGSGSLEKQGGGRLVLSGGNTYTGGTTVGGGTLVVDGSIVGDVDLGSEGRLGGGGVIGGVVGGGGVFGPGNSPGIVTVGGINPSGGLDFELEITGELVDYAAPRESVNDLIRLTGETPFTTAMTEANTISVLFDLADGGPVAEGEFSGGFFTDADFDMAAVLENATFEYWVAGEFGETGDRRQFFTGAGGSPLWYSRLSAYDEKLSVEVLVIPTTANFGSGSVTGQVTQFAVVPEPSGLLLAACGALLVVVASRRSSGKQF